MPTTNTAQRRKVRRLTSFTCTEVSVCKLPANRLARVLIAKASNGATTALPAAEVDTDRRFIAGWASVVSVDGKPHVDDQGDLMTAEDLVEAADGFMRSFRGGKRAHQGSAEQIEFTQSTVFTEEVQAALGIELGFEGWFLGGYVRDDDLWNEVKGGDFRGFSVGGSGVRLLVEGEVAKAKRSEVLTLEQAYRRTAPVGFQAIAKALREAAPRKPAKAAWRACADCPAPRVCGGRCGMEVKRKAVAKAALNPALRAARLALNLDLPRTTKDPAEARAEITRALQAGNGVLRVSGEPEPSAVRSARATIQRQVAADRAAIMARVDGNGVLRERVKREAVQPGQSAIHAGVLRDRKEIMDGVDERGVLRISPTENAALGAGRLAIRRLLNNGR